MKTTLLGIISGIVVIVISVYLKEDRSFFINLQALLITLGGTTAAVLIYFSSDAIKYAAKAFLEIFTKKQMSAKKIIDILIELSKESHYSDIFDLLNMDAVKKIPFLEKGLTLVADDVQPTQVKSILVRNSRTISEKKRVAERVFGVAGSFAPMFGMMGTIIGLISMLHQVEDPSAIPAAMGLALVTTFYGLILAALVFIPISGKIRDRNHINTKIREIIIEGVLSIQRGDNSQITKERLLGYVSDVE
ncbi:MAG: hypothetical protein B6D62_00065 [Candidatus Cloacimonas sp. 4484_275]|nr:MAG: hypothetical protein B6D62_00065 [Candidatus Cloacimonas sp. 4484_275]